MTKPAMAAVLLLLGAGIGQSVDRRKAAQPEFQTSDRCLACHNGLKTSAGEDVSIGFDWRASIMANSSRDPYWQASVRRESIDHPESQAEIEDECAVCHMPIPRYEAKLRGRRGEVFPHLPFDDHRKSGRKAADGVSCAVCHQIGTRGLGKPESFNGGFVVDPPDADGLRPEYGPYQIEKGQTRIMFSSSEGYRPTQADHIRQSEMCATCHTLYTKALGPGGKAIGELPEQVPYQEWLHSDYRNEKSCQSCHMPVIEEEIAITRVLGVPRKDAARHVFVGGNAFMLGMLNRFREELGVSALPQEMAASADRTVAFLQTRAARLSFAEVRVQAGQLEAGVVVENLGGHKLPTAYPSRRAWLHVVIRDARRRTVFESGGLDANGSIRGNDNDTDGARFEPHYDRIRAGDQVQIYESIMVDAAGRVTTGLLNAIRYVKDNRLLPHGFDKQNAGKEIAVLGEAAADPNFSGAGDRVQYTVALGSAEGPLEVEAELWYQPIGYRWAQNLKQYEAAEPRRFIRYYDAMGPATAVRLAQAKAVVKLNP